jgi:DNA invertase Pin-like site-specific DNA recombinase
VRIGYARVSTREQDPAAQVEALVAAGVDRDRVFVDRVSGAAGRDRPGLRTALSYTREGDQLVVWRLDRLARSLPELVALVDDLQRARVDLVSLTEQWDTSTPAGRAVFWVCGAFAELERHLAVERTRAGLSEARARGRLGGHPRALTPVQEAEVRTRLRAGESPTKLARLFEVSRSTIYRTGKEAG